MVIGFDAKRAFCNATGLGNYSRMVVSALAEAYPEDQLRLYTPFRKPEFSHLYDDVASVTVHEPKNKMFGGSWWRTYGIASELQHDGVDLYHGLSHELPRNLSSSLPAVVTIHDLAPWRFPEHFPLLDRMSYQSKMRHACRRAQAVVAVSTQTKNDLVELLGVPEQKTIVIGQSCHPRFWSPVADETQQRVAEKYQLPQRYVVCVGTVEQRKNQIAAVQAMAAVDPDLYLVIVGKHKAYGTAVINEAKRLGVATRVLFLQEVDSNDLPGLYAGAVCSLYLSLFEGFGIPVLESMCCGTPVVCSNVSSLPEVGGDAAVLVPPGNPDAIAEAVNRIVADESRRTALVEKSRQQASLFTAKRIAGELHDLYVKLLEKGGAS